jgi:hypothetical protein
MLTATDRSNGIHWLMRFGGYRPGDEVHLRRLSDSALVSTVLAVNASRKLTCNDDPEECLAECGDDAECIADCFDEAEVSNATGFRKEEAIQFDRDPVTPALKGRTESTYDGWNPVDLMASDGKNFPGYLDAVYDPFIHGDNTKYPHPVDERFSSDWAAFLDYQRKKQAPTANVAFAMGAELARTALMVKQIEEARHAARLAYDAGYQATLNAAALQNWKFDPKPAPIYGVTPSVTPRPVVNSAPDVLVAAPCFGHGGDQIARSVEGQPLVANYLYSDDGSPSMQHVSEGPTGALFYGPYPRGYGPQTSGPGTEDPGAVGYSGGGMLSSGAGDPNDQALRTIGLFTDDRGPDCNGPYRGTM